MVQYSVNYLQLKVGGNWLVGTGFSIETTIKVFVGGTLGDLSTEVN
jgi:hypothetical protein